MSEAIRLTQYSHGAGCGCKISPQVLDTILQSEFAPVHDPRLLVGNETRDDAAVYDLGNGTAIISTTDFFMPVVDDPFTFGRIAATNAISDIYAMGGKPVMAVAILGWPVNVLSAELAQQVVEGGRAACRDAGIALAGGHSIDTPEPIFGLAVTGVVDIAHVKKNSSAQAGCVLLLTKPLGIGILTTAEKKGLLRPEHRRLAAETMCQLNVIGAAFAALDGVEAMTDVTGFGLLGHLSEICQGSSVRAEIVYSQVPRLPGVDEYITAGAVPGGTARNFAAYGHLISPVDSTMQTLLCDPQTSGGLLVAVQPWALEMFMSCAKSHNVSVSAVGQLLPADSQLPVITVVP